MDDLEPTLDVRGPGLNIVAQYDVPVPRNVFDSLGGERGHPAAKFRRALIKVRDVIRGKLNACDTPMAYIDWLRDLSRGSGEARLSAQAAGAL